MGGATGRVCTRANNFRCSARLGGAGRDNEFNARSSSSRPTDRVARGDYEYRNSFAVTSPTLFIGMHVDDPQSARG